MDNPADLTTLIETIAALNSRLTFFIVVMSILFVCLCVLCWAYSRSSKLLEQLLKHMDAYYEEPELNPELTFRDAEELWQRDELEALSQVSEAELKVRPNNSSADWYLALVAYKTGDYPKARGLFESAYMKNPAFQHGCLSYIEMIDNMDTGIMERVH